MEGISKKDRTMETGFRFIAHIVPNSPLGDRHHRLLGEARVIS